MKELQTEQKVLIRNIGIGLRQLSKGIINSQGHLTWIIKTKTVIIQSAMQIIYKQHVVNSDELEDVDNT